MRNLGNIVKQAQKLQSKLLEVQEEVGQRTVEASAGGGMVTATVNGKQQLINIKIAPEAAADVEMLQDMIIAAINKAQESAQEMMKQAMGSVAGGINIPGLF